MTVTDVFQLLFFICHQACDNSLCKMGLFKPQSQREKEICGFIELVASDRGHRVSMRQT